MPSNKPVSYFALPGITAMVPTLMGLYFMLALKYLPNAVPFEYMGPVGRLFQSLREDYPEVLTGLVVFAVASHLVETYFCMQMCKRRNLDSSSKFKWFLSSMVFGGFSLHKLSKFKPADAKV